MMLTQQMSVLANDLAAQCRVTSLAKEETKKKGPSRFKMAGCTSVENCENEFGEKRTLADHYFKGKSIGSGGFGSVYAGTCKTTGKGVAIKSISRKKIYGWSMIGNRVVPKEVALHHNLEQKYIIKLLDYFEEKDRFYIIMEKPDKYIDLFDYITEKGTVSERSARYLFHQVLEAVQYCLSMGVVHRDVKDENILIDLGSNQVKLIDFGSGTFLQDEVYTEYEGTVAYCPPEWVLNKCYHAIPATIWSLGILLYDMLLGDVPFEKKSDIAAARLYFHINISGDAESLIRSMLAFNPQDRPTLEQVLNHPWMQPSSSSSSSSPRTSPSSSSASPNSSASSRSSSSADSYNPGRHTCQSSSPSPNLRYNLRSSTVAGAAAKSRETSSLSQFMHSPKSFNHCPSSSQSAASNTTTTFSCSDAFGGRDPPGHPNMLRSKSRLKSPAYHPSPYFQNGSSTTPNGFTHKNPHSPLKLLKEPSTGEHENSSFSTTSSSQAKETKYHYY